jgi:AcrR family transcriptional regulator
MSRSHAPARKCAGEAVFAAALAEIAEFGVRGSSMDRIAHRAGTGKAALYRRWPNVRALALDVFISTLEAGFKKCQHFGLVTRQKRAPRVLEGLRIRPGLTQDVEKLFDLA